LLASIKADLLKGYESAVFMIESKKCHCYDLFRMISYFKYIKMETSNMTVRGRVPRPLYIYLYNGNWGAFFHADLAGGLLPLHYASNYA